MIGHMTRSTPAAQRVVADARAVVLEERQRVREDERADRAFGARPDLGGGKVAQLSRMPDCDDRIVSNVIARHEC